MAFLKKNSKGSKSTPNLRLAFRRRPSRGTEPIPEPAPPPPPPDMDFMESYMSSLEQLRRLNTQAYDPTRRSNDRPSPLLPADFDSLNDADDASVLPSPPPPPKARRQTYGYLSLYRDVSLTPRDVEEIITKCGYGLRTRGLNTPLLLSASALDLDPVEVNMMIKTYIEEGPDVWMGDLHLASPLTIATFLKWALSRLKTIHGTHGFVSIVDFEEAAQHEREVGYPLDYYSTFFVHRLAGSSASLLNTLLSFLTSIVAHSIENGMTPAKVAGLLSFYVFGDGHAKKFDTLYATWQKVTDALHHLLLMYIRDQKAREKRIPTHLDVFILGYPAVGTSEPSRLSHLGSPLSAPLSSGYAPTPLLRLSKQQKDHLSPDLILELCRSSEDFTAVLGNAPFALTPSYEQLLNITATALPAKNRKASSEYVPPANDALLDESVRLKDPWKEFGVSGFRDGVDVVETFDEKARRMSIAPRLELRLSVLNDKRLTFDWSAFETRAGGAGSGLEGANDHVLGAAFADGTTGQPAPRHLPSLVESESSPSTGPSAPSSTPSQLAVASPKEKRAARQPLFSTNWFKLNMKQQQHQQQFYALRSESAPTPVLLGVMPIESTFCEAWADVLVSAGWLEDEPNEMDHCCTPHQFALVQYRGQLCVEESFHASKPGVTGRGSISTMSLSAAAAVRSSEASSPQASRRASRKRLFKTSRNASMDEFNGLERESFADSASSVLSLSPGRVQSDNASLSSSLSPPIVLTGSALGPVTDFWVLVEEQLESSDDVAKETLGTQPYGNLKSNISSNIRKVASALSNKASMTTLRTEQRQDQPYHKSKIPPLRLNIVDSAFTSTLRTGMLTPLSATPKGQSKMGAERAEGRETQRRDYSQANRYPKNSEHPAFNYKNGYHGEKEDEYTKENQNGYSNRAAPEKSLHDYQYIQDKTAPYDYKKKQDLPPLPTEYSDEDIPTATAMRKIPSFVPTSPTIRSVSTAEYISRELEQYRAAADAPPVPRVPSTYDAGNGGANDDGYEAKYASYGPKYERSYESTSYEDAYDAGTQLYDDPQRYQDARTYDDHRRYEGTKMYDDSGRYEDARHYPGSYGGPGGSFPPIYHTPSLTYVDNEALRALPPAPSVPSISSFPLTSRDGDDLTPSTIDGGELRQQQLRTQWETEARAEYLQLQNAPNFAHVVVAADDGASKENGVEGEIDQLHASIANQLTASPPRSGEAGGAAQRSQDPRRLASETEEYERSLRQDSSTSTTTMSTMASLNLFENATARQDSLASTASSVTTHTTFPLEASATHAEQIKGLYYRYTNHRANRMSYNGLSHGTRPLTLLQQHQQPTKVHPSYEQPERHLSTTFNVNLPLRPRTADDVDNKQGTVPLQLRQLSTPLSSVPKRSDSLRITSGRVLSNGCNGEGGSEGSVARQSDRRDGIPVRGETMPLYSTHETLPRLPTRGETMPLYPTRGAMPLYPIRGDALPLPPSTAEQVPSRAKAMPLYPAETSPITRPGPVRSETLPSWDGGQFELLERPLSPPELVRRPATASDQPVFGPYVGLRRGSGPFVGTGVGAGEASQSVRLSFGGGRRRPAMTEASVTPSPSFSTFGATIPRDSSLYPYRESTLFTVSSYKTAQDESPLGSPHEDDAYSELETADSHPLMYEEAPVSAHSGSQGQSPQLRQSPHLADAPSDSATYPAHTARVPPRLELSHLVEDNLSRFLEDKMSRSMSSASPGTPGYLKSPTELHYVEEDTHSHQEHDSSSPEGVQSPTDLSRFAKSPLSSGDRYAPPNLSPNTGATEYFPANVSPNLSVGGSSTVTSLSNGSSHRNNKIFLPPSPKPNAEVPIDEEDYGDSLSQRYPDSDTSSNYQSYDDVEQEETSGTTKNTKRSKHSHKSVRLTQYGFESVNVTFPDNSTMPSYIPGEYE